MTVICRGENGFGVFSHVTKEGSECTTIVVEEGKWKIYRNGDGVVVIKGFTKEDRQIYSYTFPKAVQPYLKAIL